jgi:hypothetical protein
MATQKRFIAKNGIDNNSNSIINVVNPTNAQDVATKSYVDGLSEAGGTLFAPIASPTLTGTTTVTNLTYTGAVTGGTGVINIGSGQLYKDASGNVGIGTTSPAQKLSVAGTIESTTGGVKFPDGTTQTTAATASTPSFLLMAQGII